MLFRLSLVLSFLCFSVSSAFAQDSLLAPHLGVKIFTHAPTGQIGVTFTPEKDWHIYWKNPGDSGTPPRFTWLVDNNPVELISQWPRPERIPFGPLVNFGYSEPTTIVFSLPNEIEHSNFIKVAIDWLVCKEECIPGSGSLSVVYSGQSFSEEIVTASKLMPQTIGTTFQLSSVSEQELSFSRPTSLGSKSITPQSQLDFFPYDRKIFDTITKPTVAGDTIVLRKAKRNTVVPSMVSGVLTVDDESYILKLAAPADEVAKTNGATPSISISFVSALIFALLGGLILNLMPCVLPILSMKALSFAHLAHQERAYAKKKAAIYGLGIIVSWVALGALILFLRSLKIDIGWGFQLQSPIFITLLCVLFTTLAMHSLGVIVFGTKLQSAAGKLSSHSGMRGEFLSGILAVAIATPCTAPFMGSAIAYALSTSPATSFLVLATLGLGMSLPFLLLAFVPGAEKIIPKPGQWMVYLKEFLAFPLFATVIWLLWVLSQQNSGSSIFLILSLLLSYAFGLFIFTLGRWGRNLGGFIALISVALACYTVTRPTVGDATYGGVLWEPYSEERLSQLRELKQPILLDATAAWCITCQVNKAIIFSNTALVEKMKAKQVTVLRADWTSYDPKITSLITRFGREGVPLNVYFNPDRIAPEILPSLLTPQIVENALN